MKGWKNTMINRTVLVGRLTKEIELKYTTSGTAVGRFNLAVDRNFINKNGDRETDFINCVIWRKGAENLANYTGKGSLIAVEGHLQTRDYENRQAQRIYVTEVIVDNFSLLEKQSDNKKRNSPTQKTLHHDFEDSAKIDQPFNSRSVGTQLDTPNQPMQNHFVGEQIIDFSADDLPF